MTSSRSNKYFFLYRFKWYWINISLDPMFPYNSGHIMNRLIISFVIMFFFTNPKTSLLFGSLYLSKWSIIGYSVSKSIANEPALIVLIVMLATLSLLAILTKLYRTYCTYSYVSKTITSCHFSKTVFLLLVFPQYKSHC